MTKQFNKIRTTVTIDIDVYEYWSKIAEEEDRSLSYVINKLLKEEKEEKEGK